MGSSDVSHPARILQGMKPSSKTWARVWGNRLMSRLNRWPVNRIGSVVETSAVPSHPLVRHQDLPTPGHPGMGDHARGGVTFVSLGTGERVRYRQTGRCGYQMKAQSRKYREWERL